MRRIILFISFSLLCTAHAQQTESYTFEGFYNGPNMIIQCREKPTTPWNNCTCIDSIAINDTVVPDILYEGYQIDIANKTKTNFEDSISITLFYNKGCNFRITNPQDFLPPDILPVDSLYVDEDYTLHWITAQNYPQLNMWVHIEQYKWGEWVKISKHYPISLQKNYSVNIKDHLYKGKNQFRVVVASINHERSPSEALIIPFKSKKIKYKIKDTLVQFNQETHYEIRDSNYNIATKGYGDHIDLTKSNLPSAGDYILRYGPHETRVSLAENQISKP